MKMLKKILRSIRLALGKQFLDKKTVPMPSAHRPNKILFLRQDGKIGDYIVSSFVFREIKKLHTECFIGVVCSTKNAYLFDKNPYIDQLYFVKTKYICDYIKCGQLLAKEQYDVVIDPTVTLRNRDLLFLRLISANNYIGYKKENYQLFNININAENAHFSEIYHQALEKIGFYPISAKYDVPMEEQSENDIIQFLQEKHLSNYMVVNFFGAGSARRFDDNSMQRLLDYLTHHNMIVVLLAYPEVMDKLVTLAKAYTNVFVYEKTKTIFHSISLIKYANLVISPDTSIIHIASAFEKPLIAFYSQDEENFVNWHPNNKAETHILRFHKSVNELDFTQIKPEWLKG